MNVICCHLCGSNCQKDHNTEAVKHGNTELPSDSTITAYAAKASVTKRADCVNLDSIWLVPLLENIGFNARQKF